MLTMGGVMLAMFLSALDQTVVGTAMPRIITDLGVFDVVPEGIRVVELAEGVTREFAQSKTGVPLL